MKRRTFFQTVAALTTSVLMPWKPQLPYTETMEDGWRVLRARHGDTIYTDQTIVVREGEKVRIASSLNSTAKFGILCERNAHCEIFGDVTTRTMRMKLITPEAFKRATDLFIEATC